MANQHGDIRSCGRQRINLTGTRFMKVGPQQQILRRIAAQGKLRGNHEVRSLGMGLPCCIKDTRGIRGKIADNGIDLGNGNFQGHDLLTTVLRRQAQAGQAAKNSCQWGLSILISSLRTNSISWS